MYAKETRKKVAERVIWQGMLYNQKYKKGKIHLKHEENKLKETEKWDPHKQSCHTKRKMFFQLTDHELAKRDT